VSTGFAAPRPMRRPNDSGAFAAPVAERACSSTSTARRDDRDRLEREVVAPIVVHRVDEMREHPRRGSRSCRCASARLRCTTRVLAVLRQPAGVSGASLWAGSSRKLRRMKINPAAVPSVPSARATLMPPSLYVGGMAALQHRQHHRIDVGAVARQQRHGVPAIEVLGRATSVSSADAPRWSGRRARRCAGTRRPQDAVRSHHRAGRRRARR
jgi:hypothetical protein